MFYLISKFQNNQMNGIEDISEQMHGRTNVRTEATPKVHRLRRETKNQTIPMNQSEEKWEKPHFYAFLRGLRGIKYYPKKFLIFDV